ITQYQELRSCQDFLSVAARIGLNPQGGCNWSVSRVGSWVLELALPFHTGLAAGVAAGEVRHVLEEKKAFFQNPAGNGVVTALATLAGKRVPGFRHAAHTVP